MTLTWKLCQSFILLDVHGQQWKKVLKKLVQRSPFLRGRDWNLTYRRSWRRGDTTRCFWLTQSDAITLQRENTREESHERFHFGFKERWYWVKWAQYKKKKHYSMNKINRCKGTRAIHWSKVVFRSLCTSLGSRLTPKFVWPPCIILFLEIRR